MRLLVFTQKVDKNDPVLGFFHQWLLEFSKKCQSVKVICLYEGKHDLPANVEVFSLGKEFSLGRFSYLSNLYKYLFKLDGQYDRVFVHMNPIYIVFCGWYFKIKRIPVYMWYVHRSVDLKLKIAMLFIDKVFSSTKESFGIETDEVVYLGHGIDIDKLPKASHTFDGGTLNIAHIGRITPIKNIETLINAVSELNNKGIKTHLDLFGGTTTKQDEEYKDKLKKLIDEKGLKNEVNFAGTTKYNDLPKVLMNSHISVNLTPPGGMDKAVLESILLGIPTFASNTAFNEVFGQYADLFLFEFSNHSSLASKISNYIGMQNREEIINSLESKVRKDFSLSNLISRIVEMMN